LLYKKTFKLIKGIKLPNTNGLLNAFDLYGGHVMYRGFVYFICFFDTAFLQTVVKPHGIVGHQFLFKISFNSFLLSEFESAFIL